MFKQTSHDGQLFAPDGGEYSFNVDASEYQAILGEVQMLTVSGIPGDFVVYFEPVVTASNKGFAGIGPRDVSHYKVIMSLTALNVLKEKGIIFS